MRRLLLYSIVLLYSGIAGVSLLRAQPSADPSFYAGLTYPSKPHFDEATNTIRFALPSADYYRPRVALVLSGGGARGIAQIGVLKKLEEAGIPIDYIVGSSMGAIVGGLYASGYSAAELDSIMTNTSWRDILSVDERVRSDQFLDQKLEDDRSLITLRFNDYQFVVPEAISAGYRLTAFLNQLVWNSVYHSNGDFNRLKVPFRAVATDLVRGEPAILKSGNLVTAMRASATVPLRFTPVKLDSMILVDGGIMSNIPVEAAQEFRPDIIIAVNTTSPLLEPEALDKPWNVADQVVSILIRKRSAIEGSKADILIEPDLGGHPSGEFSGLDSLIVLGEYSAGAAIPAIKRLFWQKQDSLYAERCLRPFFRTITGWTFRDVDFKGFTGRDSADLARSNSMASAAGLSTMFGKWELFSGYHHINIVLQKLSPSSSDSLCRLCLEASPYPAIDSIIIEGGIPDEDSTLHAFYRRYNGAAYTPATVRTMCEDLLQRYRSSGSSLAEITSVDMNRQTGELRIRCDEGRIRTITVHGNSSITASQILRELQMREGQTFNGRSALDAWKNLMGTDLFSDAVVEAYRVNDTADVDVLVNVRERGSQVVRLGIRVDDERNTQFGLDLAEENLFDREIQIGARFVGGLRARSAELGIAMPRVFNSYWKYGVAGYAARKNYYAYTNRQGLPTDEFERYRSGEFVIERYGMRMSAGKQIEKNGSLLGEFRFERQRMFDKDSTNLPNFSSLATLKFDARFDTQDLAYFPTSGRVIEISLESSILNLRDDVKFSKAQMYYHAILGGGRHILKPSLYFGFADVALPPTEFFALGGQNSFYGMRESEERGTQIALGSLEYRFHAPFKIFFDTYFSTRYDLGSTWTRPTEIRISQLRHGIGAALGLDSPLGPAEFSVGRSFYFLKNPNAIVWGPIMAYFSIGMSL